MATYTQTHRALAVSTPLGPDALLLRGFTGQEAMSQLFQFDLDLLAENSTAVAFDRILGQAVTVELELPGEKKRHFHGIVSRFGQGGRDARFTTYRAEVVPRFWLWTRRVQSRIFQHLTVPDILRQVLDGLDLSFEIAGAFHPRDYCVQYHESDFAFASRLMEEEGIFYFFRHTAAGHKMVLANTPQSHPDLPEQSKVIFEEIVGGHREEDRVLEWEKVQELRSGRLRLWDHSFELPHQHLEGVKTIQDSVPVGSVTHKLAVGGNDRLHLHRFPGGYAQRFDGVDPGGGERAGDLSRIFQDAERTAAIRMQQEALKSVEVRGAGTCRQFVTGHKFTLQRHFNADGVYVLTAVRHSARLGSAYHTGTNGHPETLTYENTFTCIPVALPFRPPLATPKPTIAGPQTAVVVGSPGEKIFCDKYGRVKVKFHWDPSPKKDADSSCWIRVSNNWGGSRWGGMFLPHVGQEVIVEFEDGDPDRPVVTGRVYNAECMPPRALPANKTQCNLSDHGGDYILCEGAGGKQQVDVYSTTADTQLTLGKALSKEGTHHYPAFPVTFAFGETAGPLDGFNMATSANWLANIGTNAFLHVGANWSIFVHDNWKVHVHGNHKEHVDGHEAESVKLFKHTQIGGFRHEIVGGFRINEVGLFRAELVGGYKKEVVLGRKNSTIRSNLTENIKGTHKETVGGDILVEAAKGGGEKILLQCGASSIELHKNGTITLKGKTINVHADEDINGEAKHALRLRGDKGFALSSSHGEGRVNSHDELVLQGKEFALTSTQGQGEVNAKTILNVKGGSMVKINC